MSRTHGLRGTYQSGCRCELCTKANAAWHLAARRRRAERARAGEQIKHGLSGYTNWFCRCAECTEANARRLRARLNVPAGGRSGEAWREDERRLALERVDGQRYRYTAAEVAAILGRTVLSVDVKRSVNDAKASTKNSRLRTVKNDGTRDHASRHRLRWTGAEMEIATRVDLTAAQAAGILGRTLMAVHSLRQRCAKEPKWRQMLGAAVRDLPS